MNTLIKQKTAISTAIAETIVLTVVAVLLGHWFSSDKPFFSEPGFSWLIIGPFLSGLRYGFSYAFSSALSLLLLMWAGSIYYLPWQTASFSSTALGMFFIAIISGEFHNYWNRQLVNLKVSTTYLDQRLTEVTKAFNLINISHDQLAQRVASRTSLRESILGVQTHILKAKQIDSSLGNLSNLILKNFATYISIQQAGLFTVNKLGKINTVAQAYYGGEFKLRPNDLLLNQALETHKTISLKPELANKEDYSHILLLAIPLVDVFDNLWGIILVNRMPFRAFRADNIKLAAILAGHIADLINTGEKSTPLKDTKLQTFLVQVRRCMTDNNSFSTPSSLVAVKLLNKAHARGMENLIVGEQRGLDSYWKTNDNRGAPVIFILLPLTNQLGMERYELRLEQMIKEHYEFNDLKEAGISLLTQNLNGANNLEELMLNFFRKLDINQTL